MGLCQSASSDPADKKINAELRTAALKEKAKVKFLLLGAGESGKSTIFKQLRLMHGSPHPQEDLEKFAGVVRANIVVLTKRMVSLIDQLELAVNFSKQERTAYNEFLAAVSKSSQPIPTSQAQRSQMEIKNASLDAELCVAMKDQIKIIFDSKVMKTAWLNRAKVNAIDNHRLFVDQIDTIAAPNYLPINEHIINARMRTTNVVMNEYDIDGVKFEVYDVGGQRTERKKWMPFFDDVDGVIFVGALSEYDQMLAEAKSTNRMSETLGLFRTIANTPAFKKTPVMLFLNKVDLFEEKIKVSNPKDIEAFADYDGSSFEEGLEYFQNRFRKCVSDIDDFDNRLFIHATNATDRGNGEFGHVFLFLVYLN
uniref:Uncharacterized protein n=2 Tax=Corethron hystrix TaxID=216773 RepID=A0A7S1BWI0_9STRA|mmetsp:Transcript_4727/g.9309  ORF Transcript_4727/g.9309 Transcript_4727/m.9309 type:complete len:367 (+) Transcript_4727:213-1313(+)